MLRVNANGILLKEFFEMVGRAGLLGLCPRPSGRCGKRNAVSLRSART